MDSLNHEDYRSNPVEWVERFLFVHLTEKQKRVLRLVAENRRVSVRAGHSCGKSFVAACSALWYFFTHDLACVMVTAPTSGQIHDAVLGTALMLVDKANNPALAGMVRYSKEIRMMHPRTERVHPKWYLKGVSPGKPGNMQGRHSRNMFVIIDEAAEVENKMWETARTLPSSDSSKILLLGNPTSNIGFFYDSFGPESSFENEKISVFDTPYFTGEPVPQHVLDELVGQRQVDEILEEYSEEDGYYISRFMAEFPPEDASTLIPRRFIEDAQAREQAPETEHPDLKFMGVDVAREGDDLTVMTMISRNRVEVLHWEQRTPSSIAAAKKIRDLIDEHDIRGGVGIDLTGGWGTGVIDQLRDKGVRVIGVDFSKASKLKKQYANVRAEFHWKMRRFIRDHAVFPRELPSRLLRDLTSIRYYHDAQDRLQIERKEEIKRQTGKSPDFSDALGIAVYVRSIKDGGSHGRSSGSRFRVVERKL